MLQVSVRGGTNAGTRVVLSEIPKNEWACPGCGKANAYFWTRCPNCNAERPY